MGRQLLQTGTYLTEHAETRMKGRAINAKQIEQVLAYGRISFNRNAVIYAVGHKEVIQNGKFLQNCAGVHVVCAADGAVITTYRNHSLRGLRS